MLPLVVRCCSQSKEVDPGAVIKSLCSIVGEPTVKARVRAAKNAAKAAAAPPPAATDSHATAASSAKRPAAAMDAGDSRSMSSKQPRAAGDPGALSTSYAAAADASEGAGGAGGDNGDDGSKKEALNAFDPLSAAGVDVSVEESGAEILARDGGEDEAARFGSGAMGVQLRKKLSEMSRRFGLAGGADEAACRVVAVALQERMTCIIEELRPAVNHRSNADKHAFGEGAFTKGTDPKVSWKSRAAEAKAGSGHALTELAAGHGGSAGAGVSNDGSAAAGASADARRLESLARQDAPRAGALSLGAAAADAAAASAAAAAATDAATATAAQEFVAGSADVLFVLDGDHQASRSRVVQWWRCTNAPLVRYARHTARLFPPPPAPPNA